MNRATSAPEVRVGLSLDADRSSQHDSGAENVSRACARWGTVRSCILQWPSAPEKPQLHRRSPASCSVPLSVESPVKKVLARILPTDVSPSKPRKRPDAGMPDVSPTKARSRPDAGLPDVSPTKFRLWPDAGLPDVSPTKVTSRPDAGLPDVSATKARSPLKRGKPLGDAVHVMQSQTLSPSKSSRCSDRVTADSPSRVVAGEDRRQVVERFRQWLLYRFRSIHDAFKQIDGGDTRDKELSISEFLLALSQLDVPKAEARTLFQALDKDHSGKVSMNEFIHSLTDVSEEALLWELRCRLNKNGIYSNNLDKAFDLIRRFDGQAKNNRTRFGGCVLTGEERAKLRKMRESLQMGRVEWLKFGCSLGLTIFETERLFEIIDKDLSGTVNLQEMCDALCAAAPNVSLERFVTKVLIRYGTLPEAFKEHAHKGFMGVHEFLGLCATLDLNKENALRIWGARELRTRPDSPTRDDPRGQPAMREDEFVCQLQTWAPATALDGLREQMCEQFGSVTEGRRALQKVGVCSKDVLSSKVFEAGLRATGLQHCNSELVLSTVADTQRDKHRVSPNKRRVTLDQVVGAISGVKSQSDDKARNTARVVVRNDMGPYWQQLHAMKADLRSGLDRPEKLAKDGKFAFGEKGDRLLGAVRKAVDELKEGEKQLCARRRHSVKVPSQQQMSRRGSIRRASKFCKAEGRIASELLSQSFS